MTTDDEMLATLRERAHERAAKALQLADLWQRMATIAQNALPSPDEVYSLCRIINARPESDPDRIVCEGWAARIVEYGNKASALAAEIMGVR